MSRYLHLPVFQKGYDLNLEIYRTTHNFPREYKYSLGQKIRNSQITDKQAWDDYEKHKIFIYSVHNIDIKNLINGLKKEHIHELHRRLNRHDQQIINWLQGIIDNNTTIILSWENALLERIKERKLTYGSMFLSIITKPFKWIYDLSFTKILKDVFAIIGNKIPTNNSFYTLVKKSSLLSSILIPKGNKFVEMVMKETYKNLHIYFGAALGFFLDYFLFLFLNHLL